MKKVFLFAAMLLATLTGVNAQSHNFDSIVCFRPTGSTSALLTFNPTRADSLWKKVIICHDSLFTGTVWYGLPDSGVYSGTQTMSIPVTGADTNVCYMKIISKHRDTATHVFVWDTTAKVVMQTTPTLSVTTSVTDTTISYTITVRGGNTNNVPTVVECFNTSAETYGYVCHTHTVSGPGVFTFTSSVTGTLTPATTYYLRFTTTGPITAPVVIHLPVTTLSTLTTTPYLQLGSALDSNTTWVKVSVDANLFAHAAVVKLHRRKTTETAWSYTKLLHFDSTVTGLQSSVDTMTGLTPNTAYVYAYEATNSVGANWLFSTIHTLDTAVYVDTSTVFNVARVYTSDSSMGINALFHYHGNGSNSLLMVVLLKNAWGGTFSAQTFPGLTGSNLQYVRFVVPDSGNYFVQAKIFDDVTGATDSTMNALVHVAGTSHTSGVEEINAQYADVEGDATIFSIDGKQLGVYKNVKYGDVDQKKLSGYTPGIYYAQFKSIHDEKLPIKKIPVTQAW